MFTNQQIMFGQQALKFVQVNVTSLPVTLGVVLSPRIDYLHLSRRGETVITESKLDRNITFRSSRLKKREYFTLQVVNQFQTRFVL